MAHCLISAIGLVIVRMISQTHIFEERLWTTREGRAVIIDAKKRMT